MMVGSVKRNRVLAICASAFLVILMLMSTVCGAMASSNKNPDAIARDELVKSVYQQVQKNDYAVDGGGYLKGSSLLDSSKGTINQAEFEKLTSKAQSQLVSDIAAASNAAVAEDSAGGQTTKNVSQSTAENWWKELQQTKGVGSKFLNVMLENTKPDFVTANQIYKPFSGIIGTLLGVIAVVGMGVLAVVMVSDIMYIALPPMRMLVQEGKDKNGGKGSFLISSDAIYAVEQAEQNTDGSKKHAIGIYFKRRVVMLILLGICMLYLVSGSIFTLVGSILDLVSGFIGF